MSKKIWIKNPLTILAKNSDGGIVINGTKIVELVPKGATPTLLVDEVYDAKDSVVLPGLINTHHHFYQTLTRAYPTALNKELFPWLTSLYTVWEHLDSEMIYQSTKLALSELLLSGCTTASDHHYVFSDSTKDAIDIQMNVAKELGMRVVLTRGSMSLGKKDGGLPPQSVVQDEQIILEDSIRLIKKYHQKEEGAMTQLALAPCSPFSVSTDLMIESAKLAKEYDVCLHTHLAETIDEEEFCLKKFGMRTVDYLEHTNWLHNKTWLAHGIHFNDEEIQRLGAANVGICHCPTSNMMLASGICKTLELEKAGVVIGIGVDGSASNDGSNMIQEVRMAMYLQRLKYGSSKITHQKAYEWATKGSAQVLRREDIGEIAVGKEADIAMFKLDELRFSGSHDPLAALLLCGAQKAHRVMIAGNWKVKDGEILDLDIKKLQFEHTKQAQNLYIKANSI
ncbi:8-oxoguanine deaminase [Poseidonibacter antarcticus]|uniref:8-oxoguanine deaminase n=1 Tax=Poseidonibacter antarcticus TaxID=2478538 RepID=UPI000EF4AB87|nr:8-oxoguanine deaminase [Poseidonibacter antarcticus]